MRVIIADDEAMIRAGLEKILGKMNMDIHVIGSYSNGQDALNHINKLNDTELDLIITDIKMPIMDGLMLIDAVKGRPFAKIIFSGFSEFEYARKALRSGACDYLLKPIDKQQLAEVLQRVRKQAARQNGHAAMNRLQPKQDKEALDGSCGHYAIDAIIAELNEQYDRPFDLEQVSQQVGMSSHYVSRLFKQMTGQTITDYLIGIRIEKAKQFLIDYPHMKNYEIANSVGYADPVYFQKLFKKETGYTPKEFKELRA